MKRLIIQGSRVIEEPDPQTVSQKYQQSKTHEALRQLDLTVLLLMIGTMLLALLALLIYWLAK